jgi:hypothetical protein
MLALIFMGLGWTVERSGRVSVAEAWILFLAGVFFWASGLGAILWVLVDGVYHAVGGH